MRWGVRHAFAIALAASGCGGADPCASFAGQTCLALEVRWRDRGPTVEQLEIVGTRGLTLASSRTPPTLGTLFELPVVVPIRAGAFAGEFAFDVSARRADTVVGQGSVEGSVRAREHRRVTAELTALLASDLGVDDAGEVDLAGDLSRVCTVQPPEELWVDDDAPDGGSGSAECPLPTVSEALERARTSPATDKLIHLRPGLYLRESFPLVVRNGISLVGEDAATTIVQGNADYLGAGAFLPMSSSKVTMVVGSSGGAVNRVSGMTLRPEASLIEPSLNHVGILCDRGTAPATLGTPAPLPNAVIDDMTFGPHYLYGVVATNNFAHAEGCNLRVTSSRFVGGFGGVHGIGCTPTETPRPPVSLEIGAPGMGNRFDNVGIINNDGIGICAAFISDCVSPLRIQHNLFMSVGCGMFVKEMSSAATVEIHDNQMTTVRQYGIALVASTRASVSLNTITNVDGSLVSTVCLVHAALCLANDSQLIARRNVLVGNHFGVAITGTGTSASRTLDFGIVGQEGNNVFACNSKANGTPGRDVDINLQTDSSSAYPIRMVGNSWDHAPPVQGSLDGNDLLVTSPAIAPVVDTTNPRTYGLGCPVGRMP